MRAEHNAIVVMSGQDVVQQLQQEVQDVRAEKETLESDKRNLELNRETLLKEIGQLKGRLDGVIGIAAQDP